MPGVSRYGFVASASRSLRPLPIVLPLCLLQHGRLVEGARVARTPAPAVHLGDEVADHPVEQVRLLEIDGVAGGGKYRQPRRRAYALDEDGRIQAVVVLVARHHVQRYL